VEDEGGRKDRYLSSDVSQKSMLHTRFNPSDINNRKLINPFASDRRELVDF